MLNYLAKKNEKKTSKKALKTMTWNANGVRGKLCELSTLLTDQSPDVVAFTEIKMNETPINQLHDMLTELFKTKGLSYFPYYKLRNENGGGVTLIINDAHANYQIKLPQELVNEEIIGAAVKMGGKWQIFLVITTLLVETST